MNEADSFNGTMPVNESASFIYDLQWATQQDYDANAADYSAQYYRVEGGMDWNKSIQIGIGYEVLGEDDGVAFQTPLGTNHKFNGFADAFLATPATGLQDVYAWVGGVLPGGFKTRLTYHHFLTDTHRHKLGDELDLTIGRTLSDHASALLKAAHLRGNGAQPDISRVSIELDYSF